MRSSPSAPAVTAVAPGDRVFVMPMHWCGSCHACRNGQFDLCPNRKVYGGDLPGAFAELFLVSERTAIPIPDEVSFQQAALIEPLAVVVKGLSRAKVDAGDSAAVVGGGPIGLHRHRRPGAAPPAPADRPRAAGCPPRDRPPDGRHDGPRPYGRRRHGRAPRTPPAGLGADLTVEAVGIHRLGRIGGRLRPGPAVSWSGWATSAGSSRSTSSRSSGTS